jgi:pimeloyl-ACP methyl ester carboxylesterase
MPRHRSLRALLALVLAIAASTTLASGASQAASQSSVRTIGVHYRSHDGIRRSATVLLPAAYNRATSGALPLIISPHGRGLSGRTNAAAWGDLPALGNFAVVNPDGQGRRLGPFSWGYPGQIEDLARMPEIVRATLPWLRIDRTRIYAFGGSMGGQETLLLVARHPGLLAGAAVFDAVTDFARQYRAFPQLGCGGICAKNFRRSGDFGRSLQGLAREEIGGSPKTARAAFARRSPITYVSRIASSCVPLQLWWSSGDRIVRDQLYQSESFYRELRRLNPLAPVTAFSGFWIHSYEMQSTTRLPLALKTFDLIPPDPNVHSGGILVVPAPEESAWCGLDRP